MKSTKIILLIAIFILTLSTVSAAILVDVSNQVPNQATQGQLVDVYVTFTNTGQNDIRNLEVEFKDSNFLRLSNEVDRIRTLPALGTFRDFTIKYTIQVDENAPNGILNANLIYSASNIPGQTTKNIPVRVQTPESILSITDVKTEPEVVSPGQEFELIISVSNLAQTPLRDVNLELDVAPQITGNTIVRDIPLIPLRSNQRSVNRINSGQTTEFKFSMITAPDANTMVYKLPINLRYFDDNSNLRNIELITGVKVNGEPNLIVAIDQTSINKQSTVGDVNFIIINRGLTDLKTATINLIENEDFEILSSSSLQYLGNIDSDDFDTIRYRVRVNNQNITFPITLTYMDSLNQEFTEDFVINYNLRESSNGGSGTFFFILIILIAIAGWYYYKKKNKSKEE